MLYKRVLLKLSGEFFGTAGETGLSSSRLQHMAKQIAELSQNDVQVGIVIGGGNLVRGEQLSHSGVNRVTADQMGMLATAINGLALRNALEDERTPTRLVSALMVSGMLERHNPHNVGRYLKDKDVVIFCGGTGNPFFTTDTAACLRAVEINANVMLKATKVQGVYDKDPLQNVKAQKYHQLSYDQALELKLKIMDSTAVTLARDHNMPIRVFSMFETELLEVMRNEEIGTLIKD